MSVRDMLYDSDRFPDPDKFRPERWLQSGPEALQIERAYVPFGKGSRTCLGIQ